MRLILSVMYILLLFNIPILQGHEDHFSFTSPEESALFFSNHQSLDYFGQWVNSIGRFHLLFLHFPIALIVMTVVAEWLWIWFNQLIFAHAARFMILAAAVFSLPTALLGLAYGYGQTYEGVSSDLYIWHRFFGLVTALLAIVTAVLKERYLRQDTLTQTGYLLSLFFLFICVSLTGAFGGSLAFGLPVW